MKSFNLGTFLGWGGGNLNFIYAQGVGIEKKDKVPVGVRAHQRSWNVECQVQFFGNAEYRH